MKKIQDFIDGLLGGLCAILVYLVLPVGAFIALILLACEVIFK